MSEPLIRLACFASVLIVMAGAEVFAPRRALSVSKGKRWVNNIGLGILNTAVLRLFPLAAVGVAEAAQAQGWGLLNAWNLTAIGGVPGWIAIIVSVIALDFTIYLQHRAFHGVPLFWRFHQVHHADLDLDVSSGVRFHPAEIIVSMGIKMLAVLGLGAPPVAVIVFEVLLNATSLFNHSNINLPLGLDQALRLVIVTPDMHRVHHSIIADETNQNFSFNLSLWDRLFGTYQAQPASGHQRMTLGLNGLRDENLEQIPQMLALPFRTL
jgi:sterol desaturase/sphingolipid hydroxylase (fatty acid hydroxylase superfamily)